MKPTLPTPELTMQTQAVQTGNLRYLQRIMKRPTQTLVLGSLALLAGAAVSHAAVVNLTANDAVGTTSFNAAGHWSNGAAPTAGNDYNTAGFFMRTPGNGTTNFTFAGDSLTLGADNQSGGDNGSLLEKFSTGAGTIRWLTINNFTNGLNSKIRSGGTAGALVHINGNHYMIAGNSQISADQCIWVIDSPLLGGDNIILTNFANNANDHVSFSGTNSSFTGSWYLTGAGTSAWSTELDGLFSLPGNPSTPNPGQITFLGTGQLRDTVGCSYTNSNGGITLTANGNINASVTTLIGVPITDLTNGLHSVSSLTSSGAGTLILSNANNNYSGGTTISGGILQLGVDNAVPGSTVGGDVTISAGSLDLNTHNLTINGLSGAGSVDTVAGGSPTLTVGANGDSGTLTGIIQNSTGTLSLTKVGAGTETLSGGYTCGGTTLVAGGTLSLVSSGVVPPTPGDMIISNGATVTANVSSGVALPVNNLVVGTNSSLSLSPNGTANGMNVLGSLTLLDNASNSYNFGTLSANPTAPAINVSGGISAPGSTINIGVTALGLKTGQFTLIKYTGAPLASIANFQLNLPLGVVATLINNTGNDSIDLSVTTVPDNVAWNGVNGNNWDLTTINWTNLNGSGLVAFRQGDGVAFDDTLTNDFVNPQPTNINLTATFSTYPIPGLVVSSTLPYSFSGVGGITGPTSLVKSNTGSLSILTANSFTGGISINDSGTVIITNDSALGASSGPITLNGGTLEIDGGVTNSRLISMPTASGIGVGPNNTVGLAGAISGAGATLNKTNTGTLILTARETFTGNLFVHNGTVIIDTGGSITNGSFHDVGQNGTDNGTLTMRGTGSFSTTSDFNVGDIDSSVGTLNVSGSATLTANAFFVGSANAAGSTASGTVNQTGGTITQVSTAVGEFAIGGRTSASGAGVYNMSGGTLQAGAGIRVGGTGAGTLNQNGGLINATQGINIARIGGSSGTNNLNGGTLSTFNVGTSTGSNAVFNFNGGTLLAGFSPPSAWFSGNIQANVLAGGAIIDSSNSTVTVSTPLLAGSPNGGLTKKGNGTLILTGVNTFTGPITNTAGTLFLNSASTYAGGASVNAGTVQMTTASSIPGAVSVTNGATMAVDQIGTGNANLGSLTLSGAASGNGAVVALVPSPVNNTNVALMNCGTLTLNGTNSISLPAGSLGTVALINYSGALAGSGNCTNLLLPQGSTGFISNSTANSTLYAVITATGPGIVWTGTNSASGKANLWDLNSTTNWVLNSTPTTYHSIPGDLVTFNDVGSGTVILNSTVAPASMQFSNNSKNYTIGGTGIISGPSGVLKNGTGTAVINLTNNTYLGDTVVSNGTLQAGATNAISPSANLTVASGGTVALANFNQTVGELTGAGIVNNNGGVDLVLTLGTSAGGTWNGTIKDNGGGKVALTKNGTGTWVVGGANYLNNGSAFTIENVFNAGTTIVTNGGSFAASTVQTWIANGAGSTATMIIAGGTLAVSNNVLAVGYSTNGNGTMIVNSGLVFHGGGPNGPFGAANNLFVGELGGTGTLIVNGGQVLNSQAVILGENPTGSGILRLNGGLVQATDVQANGGPTASIANFNGGTLQAVTNSGDFIQAGVTANVMSNGLVLDDGGFQVSIGAVPLAAGDSFGGGVVKQGSGAFYFDSANTYTGTTTVNAGLLAGIGAIIGPVVVAPGGTIGAGDAGATVSASPFNLSSNLTIQGAANFRISKDGGILASDLIAGLNTANYGGTLIITNVTSDTNTLVAGDTFTLFNATTHNGTFAHIAGSAGNGLSYSFANGILTVVSVATNPTNISFSVSGKTLTISWPADHLGWILQEQTNSLSTGISTNWVDVGGSSTVTSMNITIDSGTPTAFFRLRKP